MLKCITIATIHNSIFIQLLSSGIWISPLFWNTACLSYKILLYLFIMPLAEIFHLCWWNSMVCVTFFLWNDCKRAIKVRIISEINFVVKMNEGGFSKNIFQLENSDLSVLKLLAKPNQLEDFLWTIISFRFAIEHFKGEMRSHPNTVRRLRLQTEQNYDLMLLLITIPASTLWGQDASAFSPGKMNF